MKTIQFINSFHNTSARVRVVVGRWFPDRQNGNRVKLSSGQRRRVERELCGMTDCHCGGHQNYSPSLTDDGWCFGGVEIAK